MKDQELELRPLDESDKQAHADFIDEMMRVDGDIIPASVEILEEDGTFEKWLDRTRKNTEGKALPKGWVPAQTLFLFRKGENKILGAINIRFELNEHLLKYSGNIGYGVAPSERRKGYADFILKNALKFCRSELKLKRVLISCDKVNVGSARTIQKNGGVLDSEAKNEDGTLRQRYWIEI